MERKLYLDSIRGLAAIAVVYYHMADVLYKAGHRGGGVENWILYNLTQTIDLGKVGVTLFFAVSGFVVPYSLYGRGHTIPSLFHFASGRFFRLFPAYWISIIFGIIFLYILPKNDLSLNETLVNITMLQQFFGVRNIISVYWTLQIELIFYFICAILFLAQRLEKIRTIQNIVCIFYIFSLAMAGARFLSDVKLPVAVPLSLSVMFLGLLWRRALADKDNEAKATLKVVFPLFIAMVPLVSLMAYNKDYGYNENWIRYTLTYFTSAFLFITLTTVAKISLNSIVYLGKISYSIYLFGLISQSIVLDIIMRMKFAESLYGYPHILIFMGISITIVNSSIVYHLVESPCIAAGKKLSRRWSTKYAYLSEASRIHH